MTASTTAPRDSAGVIAAEIRSLRKGRGLQVGDLDQRLGPHLTELANGAADADQALRRHTLAAELLTCSTELAGDLRTAITASLGLSAETRQMLHFKDRVSWLAAELGFEYRTALRRIDTAEQLLSEEVARELRRRRARAVTAPLGWHLEELRTLVRLDTPTPEAHEHRRIVAAKDGLREVMAWLDVPSSSGRPSLFTEVLYGGQIVRKEQPGGTRFQFVVQLPRPLQAGESHEYGLLLRIPPGQRMRPYYIFSPECQCDEFDLRVRFDLSRRPAWIRRVDGETVRTFDAAEPAGDVTALDDAGEIHLGFPAPTMYLCYGAQWPDEPR